MFIKIIHDYRLLTELNVTNQLKREFFPINIIETVEKPRFFEKSEFKTDMLKQPKNLEFT